MGFRFPKEIRLQKDLVNEPVFLSRLSPTKTSRLGEAQSMRALVPKQLLITEILVTQHGPVQAARQIRALEGQRPPADAADLEWGRAHLEFQVGPAWTSVTCRWSGLSKKTTPKGLRLHDYEGVLQGREFWPKRRPGEPGAMSPNRRRGATRLRSLGFAKKNRSEKFQMTGFGWTVWA